MNQVTKEPRTPEDYARWGVRGIDAFTAEELALLQEKVEGWIRKSESPPGSKRRRPWFAMKQKARGPTP